MRDYVCLGCSPVDEKCVQVGEDNYSEKAKKECRKFINLIKRKFGEEPDGACLTVGSFPHDFGTYFQVICSFDDQNTKASDYAFNIEDYLPQTWND
jgi:hypothetical protein